MTTAYPSPVSSLQAAVAAYAAELPARLERLRAALGDLARASPQELEGRLNVARELAHKLRGSSGSYGFESLGQTAAAIEDRLSSALKAPGTRPQVSDLLTALAGPVTPSIPVPSPSPRARPPLLRALPSPPKLGQRTFLVVDPDDAVVAKARALGSASGVSVEGARSMKEALEKVAHGKYDAVLVDFELTAAMPTFMPRLRAAAQRARLPVGMLSGSGELSRRMAAAQVGGFVFLLKPLTAQAFAAAVERIPAPTTEQSRVLVLDDDLAVHSMVQHLLSGQPISLASGRHAGELVELLDAHRPDLLLVDVRMPGASGIDVCRIVRSMPEWHHLPVVLMTADPSREFRIAAYQAGADDYLLKPLVEEELTARLLGRLERRRSLAERAERDPLTRVRTRRSFFEQAAMELERARRKNEPCAVTLLDLDRFKQVNDTHGHETGDRVLAAMGQLMEGALRKEDVRGRYGGEEFAALFVGADANVAATLLERLRHELDEVSLISPSGVALKPTFSAGVAIRGRDGETLEELFRVADARLYRAKREGRNRTVADGA